MSVFSLTNKLTLLPFGQGGRGRARGLFYGAVSLPGDASGGFAALAFSIPSGYAYAPLFSSVRVASSSNTRYITWHKLAAHITDPATGSLFVVDLQKPLGHDGTGFYTIRTDSVLSDGFELVEWPRVVYRPQAGEIGGSVRVNLNPNSNGATYHFRFAAVAFDPADVKEGLVPPYLDQMAVAPPQGASP